ncbi:glycosyl transferase [Shewanella sp. KX20019]|uniref:glycosyl transferase n=1 Tax=Shewanella sp. KX20019 TaxID=2803864 RepID=UPI0019278C0F|nr:glycosyl transferase [Shewanella sp. KX20019]QQX82091.1 glycosyl transferase [Shewanella sp. KX20019]
MDNQNRLLIGVSEPAEYRQLIKVLGRGKKGSRSLTLIESFQLVRGFYDKIGTVTQLSVALMLMRVKGEVAAEVAGVALALRSTIDSQWQQLEVDIDWPCYGAKRDQLPYLLLSAKLLAEKGYRILLHGDNRVLPHRQHVAHFIDALGIVSVSTVAEAQVALTSSRICYVNADAFSPLVSSFTDIQQEIGLRSLFQSAIRCINPTNASLSLRSFFHPGLDKIHINLARMMAENDPSLGKTTVAIFKGYQGECELNPRSSTSIHVVKRDGLNQMNLPTQLNALIGSKAQEEELQAQWLTALWHGEAENGNIFRYSTEFLRAYSAVITNTAVLLMLTDSSLSIDSANTLAAEYWMSRSTYPVADDTHFPCDANPVASKPLQRGVVTYTEVGNAHTDSV